MLLLPLSLLVCFFFVRVWQSLTGDCGKVSEELAALKLQQEAREAAAAAAGGEGTSGAASGTSGVAEAKEVRYCAVVLYMSETSLMY